MDKIENQEIEVKRKLMYEFDNYHGSSIPYLDNISDIESNSMISDEKFNDYILNIGPFVTKLTKRTPMNVLRQGILNNSPISAFFSLFYNVLLGFNFTPFPKIEDYFDSIHIFTQFIVNVLAIYFNKPLEHFKEQQNALNKMMTAFINSLLPLIKELQEYNKLLIDEKKNESHLLFTSPPPEDVSSNSRDSMYQKSDLQNPLSSRSDETDKTERIDRLNAEIKSIRNHIRDIHNMRNSILLEFLETQHHNYNRSNRIVSDAEPLIVLFDTPFDNNDWWGSLYGTNLWVFIHIVCASCKYISNGLLLDAIVQSLQFFIGCGECHEHYLQRGIPFLKSLTDQGLTVDKQMILLHQFIYMDSIREQHSNYLRDYKHKNLLQFYIMDTIYPNKYMLNDYYVRGLQIDYRVYWDQLQILRDLKTIENRRISQKVYIEKLQELSTNYSKIPKTIDALNNYDRKSSCHKRDRSETIVELYDMALTKQYIQNVYNDICQSRYSNL